MALYVIVCQVQFIQQLCQVCISGNIPEVHLYTGFGVGACQCLCLRIG